MNWHNRNDNCDKVSKLATNNKIATALDTSFFLKYQHNWEVICSYPSPRVCLKNSVNDIFPEPKIDHLLSRLITFIGKIKSRGYHAFLEVKLVVFDLNLIALGVIYNFSYPLPGQFHYCFTQRGVLWDFHNG